MIAAIANATGKSYRLVRQTYGRSVRGGLNSDEGYWLVNQFGDWRKYTPRKRITIAEFAKKHPMAVVSVAYAWGEAHAIAIKDGVLIDSAGAADSIRLVGYAFIPANHLPRP